MKIDHTRELLLAQYHPAAHKPAPVEQEVTKAAASSDEQLALLAQHMPNAVTKALTLEDLSTALAALPFADRRKVLAMALTSELSQ